MSNCCDPKAPKVYMLTVGSAQVGLIGVEQAFQDVRNLDIPEDEAAEKLLEIVAKRNYIVASIKKEYKIALFKAYKDYIGQYKLIKTQEIR